MADLAMLFHWRPADMQAMELGELLHWRSLAVERHNQLNATPE